MQEKFWIGKELKNSKVERVYLDLQTNQDGLQLGLETILHLDQDMIEKDLMEILGV